MQAHVRAVEQGRRRGEQGHAAHGRDDDDPADVHTADGEGAVEPAERADDLAARAEGEQIDRLEQEADGERRHEHRRRGGTASAQRPEGDALLRERECDHRREASDDRQHRRPAARVREDVRACGDQLAVGEVDQAHDAENEPDTDRDATVAAK